MTPGDRQPYALMSNTLKKPYSTDIVNNYATCTEGYQLSICHRIIWK